MSEVYMEEARDGRRRTLRFIAHLLCLCILFVLPEMLMSIGGSRGRGGITMLMYGKSLLYLCVFYLNYYVVIGRTLGVGHNRWKFFLWNLLIIAVTMAILYWWMELAHHRVDGRRPEPATFARTLSFLLRDFVMLVLTISLAVALKLGDIWLKVEHRERDLHAYRREEELKSLKSQLNPHFLFNTLNSIYALISIDAEKAQEAVHELSGMLRYVLYENGDWVTIREETDFISNYIKLMRLRMPKKPELRVSIDISGHEEARIPPLIFVNVIENLFKHGSQSSNAAPMEVAIKVSGEGVTLDTLNQLAEGEKRQDSGIGLSNLRRRLSLIYGDGARLMAGENAAGLYEVKLFIPFEKLKK